MKALEVCDLQVGFRRRWRGPIVPVVDGVSFAVARGTSFGIVGESGCGKSTLAQALAGLLRPSAGSIAYDGAAFVAGRRLRASPAQLVFQDPQSSFNPRRRAWQLLAEPLAVQGTSRSRQRDAATSLIEQVGLSPAQLDRWPHEFSGGQRQRLAIARALATEPALLILDEPTSALDVSVQAQILNLLLSLQRTRGLTCLFISHDVAVVRHLCDEVAVMQRGRIVEQGRAVDVLVRPQHPYTQSLLAAVPLLEGAR